jgi:hypothetical protein
MSNELSPGPAARNAGVSRIRRLTRGAMVGAALLSAGFAGLAAASTSRKATHTTGTQAATTTQATTVPAAVPQPAPSSAQVPAPVAPVQSTQPPVASSGSS